MTPFMGACLSVFLISTCSQRLATANLISIRPNIAPSVAAVAAVPAIMYSNGLWGAGNSHSNPPANPTNASTPPAAGSAARLIFSVTTPF